MADSDASPHVRQKNLEKEKARIVAARIAIQKQLSSLPKFVAGSASRKNEAAWNRNKLRADLVSQLTKLDEELQEVKTELKTLNWQLMTTDGDLTAFCNQQITNMVNIRNMVEYQKLRIADLESRLTRLAEISNQPVPPPSIPNDFETWRRECYD